MLCCCCCCCSRIWSVCHWCCLQACTRKALALQSRVGVQRRCLHESGYSGSWLGRPVDMKCGRGRSGRHKSRQDRRYASSFYSEFPNTDKKVNSSCSGVVAACAAWLYVWCRLRIERASGGLGALWTASQSRHLQHIRALANHELAQRERRSTAGWLTRYKLGPKHCWTFGTDALQLATGITFLN